MSTKARLVTVGRVGKPHGLDGALSVHDAQHPLGKGTDMVIADRAWTLTRRTGTDARPLIHLAGVTSREAAAKLRGEVIFVSEDSWPLEDGEWLAEDLVGCRIEGLGEVKRVIGGPSCEVLETEDGTLVPLVRDAVASVDPAAGRIEVHRKFLGLEG